ncbi:hypothetical protein ABPG77_000723 [Micractinium sp. CCAP 211/92]
MCCLRRGICRPFLCSCRRRRRRASKDADLLSGTLFPLIGPSSFDPASVPSSGISVACQSHRAHETRELYLGRPQVALSRHRVASGAMANPEEPHVPAPPRPGAPVAYPAAAERYSMPSPVVTPEDREAYEGRPLVAGLHIPGASVLYTLLALLQLAAALLMLIAPYKMTELFFRNMHLPHKHEDIDVLFEELWRILGACLLTGAVTCYALKIGADRRLLNEPAIQRLQHGLLWFALLAVVLHLVHLAFIKSLTLWGLLIGAAVMAPTLLLPLVHLGLSGGFVFTSEALSNCLNNMFRPRHFSLTVFLYALLTILFTLAGLAYIIIPKLTLNWTFGYHTGKPAAFLWQWIGAALFFLFPAITYTLQERSLLGRLGQTVPKVLNVGLLVSALFHILELGSLLVESGVASRWMLPFLFTHWLLVLIASIVGLSASGHHPAYEYAGGYEPLAAERPVSAV